MARRRYSDGVAAHTNTAGGGAAGLEALRARDARMIYSDIVAAHIDTEGDSARWRRLCLMATRETAIAGWVIDSGGGIYCRAR